MAGNEAGPNKRPISKSVQWTRPWLTEAELRAALYESESDEESFVASDEDEYIPEAADMECDESDAEKEEPVIEQEEAYDSDESIEVEEPELIQTEVSVGKDGTQWRNSPYPQAQTASRNILRQKGGATAFSSLFTAKQIFKSILSYEICDIILRETNRKGRKVTEDYNNKLLETYKASERPPPKDFKPFTEQELDAFLGILIAAGVHKSNKEHISELWKSDSLPLYRASMSRDRFKMFLRFIRFDNQNTREERTVTDKAAAIRDIWNMLNSNLQKNYKPYECITVDEQLFPYRGRTKFTQYMPSKPAKYGIKFFWACDASNGYPLQGQVYTGKPSDGKRQFNVGERTVLDLLSSYRGSGRNVTTDNFFTSLQLAQTLKSWNMTLVGTVRKNKTFLPPTMHASKNRAIHSTNFAFRKEETLCSYVPKQGKSVVLLSSMHMTGEVEQTTAAKPIIIKYYNQTKGGVDVMDKMVAEYTVKRKTNRWTLAYFYNMLDIAALSTYIIYMGHNSWIRSTDRRRKFLKEFAKQLCIPAIETRLLISKVVGNPSTRTAMNMVLGRQTIQPASTRVITQPSRDASGRIPVVGSCTICRQLNQKQRKTRKSCYVCTKPVCDEHSVRRAKCDTCIQQEDLN